VHLARAAHVTRQFAPIQFSPFPLPLFLFSSATNTKCLPSEEKISEPWPRKHVCPSKPTPSTNAKFTFVQFNFTFVQLERGLLCLTVSQVNCDFPTIAFFDRRRKIHAMVRDSNGFSIANFIIASFATHFDVLKPPTFLLLIICF
jgi:hypothetical protein